MKKKKGGMFCPLGEVNKEKHDFLLTQLSENHFIGLRTTCVQEQASKKNKITEILMKFSELLSEHILKWLFSKKTGPLNRGGP